MRLCVAIPKYVAIKQSSGMTFDAGAYILRSFTKSAGGRTSVSKVSSDMAQNFLNSHGSGTGYWNAKYHVLRGFWTFAIQRGYTDRCPLPMYPLRHRTVFTPYIFTHKELKRLLDGIKTYQDKCRRLEQETIRAMLLLLYGAGLRIGEAVRLSCSDVDLSTATLTIRRTKFYKNRLVAISPSLRKILQEYDENRRQRGLSRMDDAPFFAYNNGGKVQRGTLEIGFRKLRHHVGIGATKGRGQPRIHDLRHTFAVHRVIAWYRDGLDVQQLLPGLSTHLGHTDLASTQIYLTMTPELLVEASLRFERYVGEVARGEA